MIGGRRAPASINPWYETFSSLSTIQSVHQGNVPLQSPAVPTDKFRPDREELNGFRIFHQTDSTPAILLKLNDSSLRDLDGANIIHKTI